MESRQENTQLSPTTEAPPRAPVGGFIELGGETWYRIAAYQLMDPFLMSVPSDTDLWMFIASGGGLTAGRVDAEGSLFPYRTVDQLHDAGHHTGPVTLIRIDAGTESNSLWEPFGAGGAENAAVERALYKNTIGNKLTFEETRHDLGLVFRYTWAACDEFGWVRTATLENRGKDGIRAAVMDGFRNILPYGAPLSLYQQSSNLVDAYKKSEVDPESGLGIFSLTAGITDRAEALEVLRANTVWCCGLEEHRVHLSLNAVDAFRQEKVVPEEAVLNGARGNFLVSFSLDMNPGDAPSWHLVGDTGRDHAQVADLRRRILNEKDLPGRIHEGIRQAGDNLRRNVASADGLQMTGRTESWAHHFSNVLFNNMRGGVFSRNYEVPLDDFEDFLHVRNTAVAERLETVLAGLPETITVFDLHDAARKSGDPDFRRLCHEYLPLHFGRRHGDPSRPWNRFAIRVRNHHGERELSYQGNWRDIFQNWEALGTAFPGFLSNIVARFVNASTVDGFNPYRVTRDGVDWETVTPDDPWSNIGYWGDHQIIYLLKLLEEMDRYEPGVIKDLLGAEIFSYADVPYRIKPYAEILKDPRATIEYDTALDERIDTRVAAVGTDGKLLTDSDGNVYKVNLLEKLLVPALSKLSNLIPDAGIWMNTQRPEWNDANNALAGGGVSVVTLCYLRRYLDFLAGLFEEWAAESLPVSSEIVEWFGQIESALSNEAWTRTRGSMDPADRKMMMDLLGEAFSRYRDSVYRRGFSGTTDLNIGAVARMFRTARTIVDRGITANRREDGLFHTYNLLDISLDSNTVQVLHLQEMLEGQVAVLSSGILDPAQTLEILERLYASDLYRADQRSFMLYPAKELPGFLAKNLVPAARVAAIPALRDLAAAGDRSILVKDSDGGLHFHGSMQSSCDLEGALDALAEQKEWAGAVAADRTRILDLFEDVFRHKAYTGRSGVMYGYEGLGCIYWHMVAKLLLAVQEIILRPGFRDQPREIRDPLARMYFKIRSGIGYEKTAAEYGAFPTDPYSHTPPAGGAKQPGMTGQVKEEILTRLGELGVHVEGGAVGFEPVLLRPDEFLDAPGEFQYVDVGGKARSMPLAPGTLAFTVCQVPVIFVKTGGETGIRIRYADGSSANQLDNKLGAPEGSDLFARNGKIERIQVGIPEENLSKT